MEETSSCPFLPCSDEGIRELCPEWEEDGFPEASDHEIDIQDREECIKLGYAERMIMLSEDDIPGASLKGRNPNDLTIVQLKRWLVCRGAPLSGNKAQLVERVQFYIKYGWDEYLIDPDNGVNSQRKLSAAEEPNSHHHYLLKSVPKADDPQWTSRLYNLPKITFGTLFDYLVERLVFLRRVSYVEDIADERATTVENVDLNKKLKSVSDVSDNDDGGEYVQIEYTRTLRKAYHFFRDGHVQNIKFHCMPSVEDCVCVSSNVLPSMRKDRIYKVFILMHQSSAKIFKAYCSCPAGLAGCCNHVTATLYCLEDYIHRGLRDDERQGCTERLQTWNQSTPRSSGARPTDDVKLIKHQYGVEKRARDKGINHWDCRPVTRRIIDPNKSRVLRTVLSQIAKQKLAAASKAVDSAHTEAEKKKANHERSILKKYGPSCFVQLLDDEPAPSVSHEDEVRKQRLARAAVKKEKFQRELAAKLNHFNHDHTYCGHRGNVLDSKPSTDPSHLRNVLYTQYVVVSSTQAIELEAKTRAQFACELWHNERKLRITASMMKEVCHRKPNTNCKAFVERKLFPKPLETPAVCYGRKHENDAVLSYVKFQNNHGIFVNLKTCGLVINPSTPWIAATPDRIIMGKDAKKQGCLEVKCPYVCEQKSTVAASKDVAGFCLVESDGSLHLSKSHGYFYQVQTQMYVTNTKWCDFVVWSPKDEDPFIERIEYDSVFMGKVISKVREFYFNKFLPSITSYVILPSRFSTDKSIQATTSPSGSTRSMPCLISSVSIPSAVTRPTAASVTTISSVPIRSTSFSNPTRSMAPSFSIRSTDLPVTTRSTDLPVTTRSTGPSLTTKTASSTPLVITRSPPPSFTVSTSIPDTIRTVTTKQTTPLVINTSTFIPTRSSVPSVSRDLLVTTRSTALSDTTKTTTFTPLFFVKSTVTASSTGQSVTTISTVSTSTLSSVSITPSVITPSSITTHSSITTRSATLSTIITANAPVIEKDGFECLGIDLAKPSMSMYSLLQQLQVRKHAVNGDGSCLYHAVAHQAGLIPANSKGDFDISMALRKVVLEMMYKYPQVRKEDGLSMLQWLEKQQDILNPDCWGGDLEVRLLALGLKRCIIVLTIDHDQSSIIYARKFPADTPPVVPKMRGGIFIPLTTWELCEQWNRWKPSPLLIMYNGHSHYDSTLHK